VGVELVISGDGANGTAGARSSSKLLVFFDVSRCCRSRDEFVVWILAASVRSLDSYEVTCAGVE
jgi:hypothetical protein